MENPKKKEIVPKALSSPKTAREVRHVTWIYPAIFGFIALVVLSASLDTSHKVESGFFSINSQLQVAQLSH
jgi:hypothetical protein